MTDRSMLGLRRGHFIALACAYVALTLYSSTVIGPMGFHFVYRDPAEAWHALLATPYVDNGSDQRADWMANLLLCVPYGFLLMAALWPRRGALRPLAALLAFALAFGSIAGIKYCQLFFPPRTVTLNYILAQSIGAAVGIASCFALHRSARTLTAGRDPVGWLVLGLRVYAVILIVFLLMPLDFALNASDLKTVLQRLPESAFALPGVGRPLLVRIGVVAASTLAFMPIGMLLGLTRSGVYRVGRGIGSVAIIGVLLCLGLFALSALLISGYAMSISVAYRTLGIVLGAGALGWLTRQDPMALRRGMRALAPWLVPPYLVALLAVSGLVSAHWLSPGRAAGQLAVHPRTLIPLYNFYIVTKAQAAKNILGHAALYAPVGAMIWMRFGRPMLGLSFCTAALLTAGVELARCFRPGLEGDINIFLVAGVSAGLASLLLPSVWSVLEEMALRSNLSSRQWSSSRAANQPLGRTGEVGDH